MYLLYLFAIRVNIC